MQRFIIKEPKYEYKSMRMYYKSIDEAKQKHPDAEITIDMDKSFIDSVEKIKALSEHTFHDYKGREVWKIPHNGKFILYRQYEYDGEYIDGCDYQRWDNVFGMNPITWTASDPKNFEKLFLRSKPFYDGQLFISLKELRKRKAKRFYNKSGRAYWKDNNGLFYMAMKYDLPGAAENEEYEKFKDNRNAVRVWYGTEPAFGKTKWFDNMDSFLQFFNNEKESHPSYLPKLQYRIREKGYKKLPPTDRKVVCALPYIDIDTEISLAQRDTANINAISRMIAKMWCDQIKDADIDLVEDIVKKYMEVNDNVL